MTFSTSIPSELMTVNPMRDDQFDIGSKIKILSGFEKKLNKMLLVRSMSKKLLELTWCFLGLAIDLFNF
jgi:hypothetical protein